VKSPAQVKALISAKLSAHQLPTTPPMMTSTGTGNGAICAACDEPIRSSDLDVDCLWEASQDESFRLHIDCFTEWRRLQAS
jgi:hypothetical protein